MDICKTVRRTIEEKALIRKGDVVLLGFSGGPDSLCLLHVLAALQSDLGFKLEALHVNHLLRGDEANSDMQWVSDHCRRMNVPLKIAVCDVRARAEGSGEGLEETGRKARMQALKERAAAIAAELRAQGSEGRVRIALAHNRDDQAETVLMRVMRGTGVHGLSAMDFEREDGVIRPLLAVPRSEIERYCSNNGLQARVDRSNKDLEYTRNRIRHRLIPVLEREFNPNLKEALARLADSAREDDAFLNRLAQAEHEKLQGLGENGAKASAKTASRGAAGSFRKGCDMPLAQLAQMEPAVAKRLVRFLFAEIGLKEDIASAHLNALLNAVRAGRQSGTFEFPQGYRAQIASGRVVFRGPASEDPAPEYFLFHCVLPADEAQTLQPLAADEALLDAEKALALGGDLVLRTRQAGDRIRPAGMTGSKKLQDYFVDRKIPRDERDRIQLLCCGHKVLWVRGKGISEDCRVDASTRFVLLLELHRLIY